MLDLFQISDCTMWGMDETSKDWTVKETFSLYYRLYYFLEGEGIYECSGNKETLHKGCIYIIPIHAKFLITSKGSVPVKLLWFHFNIKNLIINELIEINPKICTEFIAPIGILYDFTVGAGTLRVILNTLDTILFLAEKRFTLNNIYDERIQTITNFIRDNYNRNISNKELADLVFLDSRYLIRLFKKIFNQTPHSYIQSYRIFKASMLLTKGCSVSVASRNVGFSDTKVFARTFKKHTGKTASTFKKDNFYDFYRE